MEASQETPGGGDPAAPVTFQTFYNALAGEGTWIQTPQFGYVWQPTVTDPQWAPYTDGHWVYTQDGWTWISDEPWGWATYHYGRWANLDGVGWCWVPGYVWGPAWVSWRYGDGYAGWAPLPPDSLVGVDYDAEDDSGEIGFHIGGDCDSFYGIGAGWYNFLPVVFLGDRNYRGYYVNRYSNYRLINHTINVTNINVDRPASGPGGTFSGISLGGPLLLQVNSVAQTPVTRVRLVMSEQPGRSSLANGSMIVYAPRVEAGNANAFRPATISRTVPQGGLNRGTDIARPLLVNAQLTAAAPTARQIEEARSAQETAPASAKVATLNMSVPSISSRPLTALRPGVSFEVHQSGGMVGNYPSTYSGGAAPSTRSSFTAPRTYAPAYSTAAPGAGSFHGATGGSAAPSGQSFHGAGGYNGGVSGGGQRH
jgi:hypothetical protein